jgi:hypothetical protein
MNDSDPSAFERRRFTRAAMTGAAELHQGDTVWQNELRYLSLDGFELTLPKQWDADYSHPFNVFLSLDGVRNFEAYAHLMHIQGNTMGLQFENLEPERLEQLRKVLAPHIDDETLSDELRLLEEEREQRED